MNQRASVEAIWLDSMRGRLKTDAPDLLTAPFKIYKDAASLLAMEHIYKSEGSLRSPLLDRLLPYVKCSSGELAGETAIEPSPAVVTTTWTAPHRLLHTECPFSASVARVSQRRR